MFSTHACKISHLSNTDTMEILRYLQQRERIYKMKNYLEIHEITESNRAAVINWIQRIEAETLNPSIGIVFLAVKIIDLFLSRTNMHISKSRLQLMGMASLILAYKYDVSFTYVNYMYLLKLF